MTNTKRIFTVATDAQLVKISYRNRLKLAVLNLGISQRDFPDEIQNMFRDEDGKGTKFQYAPVPFEPPLVDDVWNDNWRYLKDFMLSTQCEYPERDRLIDLLFRVRYPDIAKHFDR